MIGTKRKRPNNNQQIDSTTSVPAETNNNPITSLSSTSMSPIDCALFVDNDESIIQNINSCSLRNMDTLKICGQKDEIRKKQWKHIQSFTDPLSENPFYLFLQEQEVSDGEYYDSSSGIKSEDCENIKYWVEQKFREGFKQPAVLFDFDRTLSLCEGIFGLRSKSNIDSFDSYKSYLIQYYKKFQNEIEALKINDMIEYYMGGKERLEYLQSLVETLELSGVALFVVTNNGACPSNRGFYEEFISYLFKTEGVVLICGKDFNYDKCLAVKSTYALNGLVITEGGKRKHKRKTRRSKKTKRKTRKH